MSLPERDYRSGLAEVIKHGIVLDADYFAALKVSLPAIMARDLGALTRVIAGSCRLKASVVERDEQEAELRAVLNYGHTVGHALEAVTGYARWTHGEAVALGIAAASRLAERLGVAGGGVRQRQLGPWEAVGLPTWVQTCWRRPSSRPSAATRRLGMDVCPSSSPLPSASSGWRWTCRRRRWRRRWPPSRDAAAARRQPAPPD